MKQYPRPSRIPWPALRRLCSGLALLAICGIAGNALAQVRVTDDLGREVTLAAPAKRIIALYGGFDEILSSMDLTSLLVARTRNVDDAMPPELANLPAIGTHLRPNFELIAEMAPDLVLQMGGRDDVAQSVEALARLHIPVVVLSIKNFDDLFTAIARIGELTGHEDKAARLTGDMRAKLATVAAPAGGNRPKVYYEVREQSPIGAGRGSFVNDVIRLAGGENALASDEKFVRLSEETVLAADPDVYLVQRGPMNQDPSDPKDRPRLAGIRAVKTGRVYFVDEKTYSRPSPHSVDAVADLAAKLRGKE
jgi:iron complex transport system substrate-binding protein